MTRKDSEVRLVGLREASERLGLALWTLRKWASNRKIPTIKLGGKVLVDVRDLDRLVETHRRDARSSVAV